MILIAHTGCNTGRAITRTPLCRELKNGQRLVNMLATGVPAIVFDGVAGHREVLEGTRYPIVKNIHEALELLAALIADAGYRMYLSNIGLDIAASYDLEKVSGRMFDILKDVAARRGIVY